MKTKINMKKKTIIGKIYANWCGHCQSLKPEWDIMRSQLANNKHIEFIEIEEGEYEKMNKFKLRFPDIQINGYPTIFKIYPNKKIEYYTGNRLAYDIKKWSLEKIKINKKTQKIFRKNSHNKTNNVFRGLF